MVKRLKAKFRIISISIVTLVLIIGITYVIGQVNDSRVLEIEIGKGETYVARRFEDAEKLRTQGKEAEALQAFQDLLEQHPNTPIAPLIYLNMGFCYLDLDKPQMAIAQHKKILSDYPNSRYSQAAWFALGATYREAGEYENALDAFGHIVQRWPHTRWAAQAALVRGGTLVSMKRYEDAITDLMQLVTNEKTDADFWKGIAMDTITETYIKLGDRQQAIETLQERREEFGETEKVLYLLSNLYNETGQYVLAETTARKLLEQSPTYHNRAAEKLITRSRELQGTDSQ